MDDKKSPLASGGFMFKATDDGEWQNLGYVDEGGIAFVSDSDEEELDKWHEALLKLNEPVSFTLRPEWYSLNRLYKLAAGRCRYTVPMLRHGRKGHRK